jgi:hypothetical protein
MNNIGVLKYVLLTRLKNNRKLNDGKGSFA